MDYPTKVRGWLESDIAEVAANPEGAVARPGKDFTRKRKLGLATTVGMLVTMGPGPCPTS